MEPPSLSEAAGIRYLHFGTPWIQGAMSIAKPSDLVLEYTAQMMAWLVFLQPQARERIGMLGLGAGSLTRFCLKHLKNGIEVVEWNPQVTAICHQYFRLPQTERLNIVHEDAGHWVEDKANHDGCAVLMVDLYDAEAQGPVRDSLAFYQACRQTLTEPGVLTVNLFGAHHSFSRNIRHLSQAFGGRLLFLPQIDEGNQIVLAFKGPPMQATLAQLLARAEQVESRYGLPARRWVRSWASRASQGVLVI